jgi:hypothetical protein
VHLLKALPELLTAALLFAVWKDPLYFGAEWVRAGVMTLLLEFFVIHSGGFMAVLMFASDTSKRTRTLQLLGLSAFYLLFISAFAWGFDAWWMLPAFAWLVFGKLQAVWGSGSDSEAAKRAQTVAIVSWALSVAVYLGSVFATAVPPGVPKLGITEAVRDAAGFDGNSTGLWESEPHRAIAGAVLYFIIMGLFRPYFSRWQARGKPA